MAGDAERVHVFPQELNARGFPVGFMAGKTGNPVSTVQRKSFGNELWDHTYGMIVGMRRMALET